MEDRVHRRDQRRVHRRGQSGSRPIMWSIKRNHNGTLEREPERQRKIERQSFMERERERERERIPGSLCL